MLREPLHTTSVLPPDPRFPHQQRVNCHVQQQQQQPVHARASRSASAASSRADAEGSVFMALTSTTFWRSPYSEALRQSRSSLLSRGSDGPPTDSGQCPQSAARDSDSPPASAKRDELKGILKNSSDGRESGSESSSEARPGRGLVRGGAGGGGVGGGGILCKSSLSGSSHQSGEKVQKRVQFEDSTVNTPSVRPPQSARSSGTAFRPEQPPLQPRALSASLRSSRTSVPRMPSIGPDRQDLLIGADKGCFVRSVSCSPRSPGHILTSHPHPRFILRPHSGPLVRGSSVSEQAPSKCPESQCCSHPALSARSAEGTLLGTAAESSIYSSRRDPAALEYRVYRQTPVVRVSCPRVSLVQSSAHHGRVRSASGYSHTRPRPFVPDAMRKSYPPPAPSSSLHNEISLKLNPRKPGVYACPHERQTTAHRRFLPATDMDEAEDKEESPESFLNEEKALQILHWLKEVHDKQAREGRSSVFVSSILREG